MSDHDKVFWEYDKDENPWHPQSPDYNPLYESAEVPEECPDHV